MISIVICSRTPDVTPALRANIAATIGVIYELIVINNSTNAHNIFEAYNIGVQQSSFPYICFMHDDVRFHTHNWGEVVNTHFEDEKTGAIGIAGSPYLSPMPGSWWAGGLVNEVLMRDNGEGLQKCVKSTGNIADNKIPVVVLDGAWICIKKELFGKIKFDDINFHGFHFYDVDICLQIHRLRYRLYCVFDVLLEHFGKGTMNNVWTQNAMILRNKWGTSLPAKVINLSYNESCAIAYKTLGEYLRILVVNKTPLPQVYKVAIAMLFKFYKGYGFIPVYLSRKFLDSLKSVTTRN